VTGEMIRFADMDGDGNADFLVIAEDGSIRMWKNRGIIGTKVSSLYFLDLDGNSSLLRVKGGPEHGWTEETANGMTLVGWPRSG
jgi:hypothetical protein